ncbi:MAG: hypothetical protein HDS31_05370 [Bacteroides sp.]|nr:hypothetical protein [Bacteroides sp.]
MKLSLFEILEEYTADPDSPNILLNVTLADLHQLVVDTIDTTLLETPSYLYGSIWHRRKIVY